MAFKLMISQRSFPHSGVSVEFWGTPGGAEFGFNLVTRGMAGNAGFLKPEDNFGGGEGRLSPMARPQPAFQEGR